ncbi:xyloglucan endotransglucosylase/hydrolase protein 2-like [Senna tora]|uniref:Xyloglucan endotransglucosylase/hydrolase protein 2-like n=1 Tax=Senna tora TaxID=362788 RepID=A0A834U066_9FABA|nr:xyloglucan endotransglucosylase/hydrolase protein 2-like [Senna tora]
MVLPLIKGNKLGSHIDGTSVAPPPFIVSTAEGSTSTIPNPAYEEWTKDGGEYPTKAMTSFGRLWNGTWASGGADVDWNAGPFVAEYRGFGIYECQTQKTKPH